MNKYIETTLIIFIIHYNLIIAQIEAGFDSVEAKTLISICNSYTFLELFDSDTLILPDNFSKVYTSEIIGLDNLFQVYEGNKVGVINFRGSTTETSSWLENFYSAMIPAEGIIKVNDTNRYYKFANDTNAAVHSGYALATVLLCPAIIEQINALNAKKIYHIYITGHSQGGSLAHMVRAYLGNLSDGKISSKNVFKTYTFANPMCGNEVFASEYDSIYSSKNMSFSILNPNDFVTKLPMQFTRDTNLYGNLFFKSWMHYIAFGEKPDLKNKLIQMFEPALTSYINSTNLLIEALIKTSYVSINLPTFVSDINYYHVGLIYKLKHFPSPIVPVDITHMSKRKVKKLIQDENGKYYDKQSSFFHHKPYNYYVAILREYFPEEYNQLDIKYLPT